MPACSSWLRSRCPSTSCARAAGRAAASRSRWRACSSWRPFSSARRARRWAPGCARNARHTMCHAIDLPGPVAADHDDRSRIAAEAAQHRATRRLSEIEFIGMSRGLHTVVLDARSSEKYRERHVRGAVNLSFPDITVESLRRLIPHTQTRILIYCNNNFVNAEGPFPAKLASASLNLSTYVALYNYGYR